MEIKGGYTGKILEVDLTTKSTKIIDTDPELARKFLGGVGLGAYYLWKYMEPGVDPLDGERNVFIFMTGPLSGTPVPAQKNAFVFKSPQHGGFSRGHQGGNWNQELKYAGWDGLIIRGKAEKPTYLFIKDDEVEFRDASNLWGLGTYATAVKITKELKDPFVRVVCIGPAGEHLVKITTILTEFHRSGGRYGSGAVLGSKNLKAVAVRGTKGIKVADLDKLIEVADAVRAQLTGPGNAFYQTYGILYWNDWANAGFGFNYKNFQEAWVPPERYYNVSPEFYKRELMFRKYACFACAQHCKPFGVIHTEKFKGMSMAIEYEGTANLITGCGITDFREGLAATHLADDLGLDYISCGKVISFAKELYQRGILTKEDLGGIELEWENIDAQLELMKKIAYREGIGDILAEGCKKAAKRIGKGAEKYAMVGALGGELSGSDPRTPEWDWWVDYMTGDRGSCHNAGETIETQNMRRFMDSAIVCFFVTSAGYGIVDPSYHVAAINAVTGWDLTVEEANKIGERIWNLEICFSIREGFRRSDWNYLPPRMFEEPLPSGPHKGFKLDRDEAKKWLDDYYRDRGWDVETGIPTEEKLRELGLDEVISEFKSLGIL